MSDKNKNRSRERKKQPAAPAMRERAAFQVALFSTSSEPTLWETRAYHEESDTRTIIEGLPAAALTDWMRAIVGASTEESPAPPVVETIESRLAEPSPSIAASQPDQALDSPDVSTGATADFTHIQGIGPVIQERLVRAGIVSYSTFAHYPTVQLVQIVNIRELATERISAWQQQAHELAQHQFAGSFLPQPAAPPVSEPERQPDTVPQHETAAALAVLEIALDSDDQPVHVALVRPNDPGKQRQDNYERMARFFLDATPILAQPNLEVIVELSELEVEEVAGQGAGNTRLHANLEVAIHGLGVALLTEQQARFACYVIALNQHHGTTTVLAALHQPYQAGRNHYPLSLALQPLTVGRYLILAAVVTSADEQPVVVVGPWLRVQ